MSAAGMINEQSFEKHIEKQMGCMTGFLHLFDRHQILSGKRHYSTKRLPSSLVFDTTSESEKSTPASPAISREFSKPKHPSPEWSKQPDLRSPPKSPLPLPMFELKEGTRCSWKFGKEAPRLSLDSRATTDAKGSLHPKEIRTAASILTAANRCDANVNDDSHQHRSPSVIARLMGLEPLPDSDSSSFDPDSKPELRRSASESRVSRDLFHSRFISEKTNFSSNQSTETANDNSSRFADPINYLLKNANKVDAPKSFNRGGFNSPSPWNPPRQRKSFFDSGDFFPEPRHAVSIYGEIENRLKLRGIEEPSKDLETLKQILEALQLKGLLHSRKHSEQNQISHLNFIYDGSPIVVMKPSRSPNSTPFSRRTANEYSTPVATNHGRGGRRNHGLSGENSPSMSPRRDRNIRSPSRTGRGPSPTTTNRSEGNAIGRRSNSLAKPKPLTVETHRRTNESAENRRLSPVHSPKLNPKRTARDPPANNRSPRNSKSTIEKKSSVIVSAEDESSSISGSSITNSTDTERSKNEELKEGRNLLERCDKLLHSIAEMTATDMQPSPVSVLDSSLYKDESSTPSPVTTRRSIDFKDDQYGELEDEIWSPEISSQDSDFVYVSDILRASHYLPEESDVFLLLEKQQYLKGKDVCKESRLQRKLIFDIVHEILDRNRHLPPWKVVLWSSHEPSLDKVWSEFQRIREREVGEDLFDSICGVLKKDLAGGDGINGWEDCPLEMAEAILDIERLIFKDLIGEAIRDLASLESRNKLAPMMPRRKLVFSTPNS